jgi:hypothetical protein
VTWLFFGLSRDFFTINREVDILRFYSALFISLIMISVNTEVGSAASQKPPVMRQLPPLTKPVVYSPKAPSGLTATVISDNQIRLSWKDNNEGKAGFRIEKRAGEMDKYAEIARVNAGQTFFDDKKVTPNITYYYRIRAHIDFANSERFSDYSGEVRVKINRPGNTGTTFKPVIITTSQLRVVGVPEVHNTTPFSPVTITTPLLRVVGVPEVHNTAPFSPVTITTPTLRVVGKSQ